MIHLFGMLIYISDLSGYLGLEHHFDVMQRTARCLRCLTPKKNSNKVLYLKILFMITLEFYVLCEFSHLQTLPNCKCLLNFFDHLDIVAVQRYKSIVKYHPFIDKSPPGFVCCVVMVGRMKNVIIFKLASTFSAVQNAGDWKKGFSKLSQRTAHI